MARPIVQRGLTGAGAKGAWIPLNQIQLGPNVSLFGVISNGASLTYTVQYTPGGPQDPLIASSITRVAAVATVVLPNHGLTAGDCVEIERAGGAPFDGVFDVVSIVDANTFTYACANSGPLVANGDLLVRPMPVYSVTGMTAQAARATAALTNPASAVRIIMASFVSGSVDFYVLQGFGR